MKKTPAIVLAALLMLIRAAASLQAEAAPAAQYALGDQVLSISAGPLVPLFFLPVDPGRPPANLFPVGGAGSIAWSAYLTGELRLGLEIGGMFAFSPNANALLELPILARLQYVFTLYPFEVPVGIGIGANIVKYQERSTIDLLLKPGASALWIYDSKWSFGLNAAWWWDLQFAADPAQSRIGSFLELSLSALYHY